MQVHKLSSSNTLAITVAISFELIHYGIGISIIRILNEKESGRQGLDVTGASCNKEYFSAAINAVLTSLHVNEFFVSTRFFL